MTLDLDIGQTTSHNLVIANLPEKFIVVGADFLRKFDFKLDFEERPLTMTSKQIKLDYDNYHNM